MMNQSSVRGRRAPALPPAGERRLTSIQVLAAAVAVGVLFALLDVTAAGVLAARPMPHWYGVFARAHPHLGLGLWLTVLGVPIAVIAAVCGLLLGVAARGASGWLPGVSLLAWQLYLLTDDLYSASPICPLPLRSLWATAVSLPASSILDIALPASALLLGFQVMQRGVGRDLRSAS